MMKIAHQSISLNENVLEPEFVPAYVVNQNKEIWPSSLEERALDGFLIDRMTAIHSRTQQVSNSHDRVSKISSIRESLHVSGGGEWQRGQRED